MRESRITFAQQGVYIDCVLNPEDLQYNNPYAVTFPQGITAEKVCKATEAMMENHPVFFSHFEERGGEVYQVYATAISVTVKKGALEEAGKAFVRPFDIQQGPLCRAEVIDAEQGVVLLLDIHHLVYDGTSLDVMLREICTLLQGGEIVAERHSYAEYAESQPSDLSDHKTFYDQLFPQGAKATQIAGDLGGGEGPHAEEEQPVSTPEVMARAKALGTAPSALFLAASLYTLSRYANSRDLCLTTISNGRSNPLAEGTVGMFVHTLPVVAKIEDQSVETFIHQVRQHTVAVRAHEEYPFANLANDYGLEQHVRFAYQYGTLDKQYRLQGGELKVESLRQNSHASSLTITIQNRGGRPAIVINYDTAKYTSDFVARMAESVDAVVAHFLDNPQAPLRTVSIMSTRQQAEVETMHHTCIDSAAVRFNLFHESVEHWARQTPEAVALIAANETLTYRQLNERANILAHALIEKGVQPGDRVCLLLPRTSRHIIAMFGVMKTGAAYIPCDPEYPADRIKHITEDSHARYIITTQDKLADYDTRAIDVETLLASTLPESCGNPMRPIAPDALAYLIYTSGSTGRPKGVMIPHKGICNYLTDHPENRHFHALVSDCKTMLSITTVSFDLSLKEIGASLYNGMTLVFADENQVNDPRALAQLMQETGVDGFSCTPSRLKMFLEQSDFQRSLAKCRYVVLGGEKYPATLLPQVKAIAPQARLFNTYGPTEISVSSNGKELTQSQHVTIGRPLLNVEEYVVDEDGNELPVGVTGELLIGGAGVGAGYNDMAEKTAESFIIYKGKRCYKSGDYAYWNREGEIEILGRKDHQIKLNGLRIELGEVETVLNQQPQVKEGVVMIRTVEGNEHLVAYYVPIQPSGKDLAGTLKEQMGQKLTHYMVPTIFVALDKMPISANGKTDLKALPQPELTLVEEELRMPTTAIEQALYDMVEKILGNSKFGINTNLFSVGLTSLLAIRLSVQVGESLHANLNVRDILRHPTIEEIAKTIRREARPCVSTYENGGENEPQSRGGNVANGALTPIHYSQLSFPQQGIYAECMSNPEDIQYNIPVCITLPPGISVEAVKNALAQVVAAHPGIDTHFQNDDDGETYQCRMEPPRHEIPVVCLTEEALEREKKTFVQPFDLQQGPLYRLEIAETPTAVYLFADFHHLVMDGGSLDLFYKQLCLALDGQTLQQETYSYYQFAAAQTIDSATEQFFATQIAQIEEPSELLPDKSGDTNDRAEVVVPIDLQPVEQQSRKLGITPATFYLSALTYAVSRYTAEELVGIATISNGRSNRKVSNTFGMFVNTLPFVSRVDTSMTVEAFLRQTSETFLDTLANEDYPYSKIVAQYHYAAKILYAYQVGVIDSYSCEKGLLKIEKLELQKAKFPIAFFVEGDPKRGGQLRVEYNSGLFTQAMAQSFVEAVRHVVSQLLVSERLDQVEPCDESAIALLDTFNPASDKATAENRTVLDLFQQAVRQYPDNEAVVFKEKHYTYKQLDAITDKIGARLYDIVKQSGKSEPVVSILIPRNEYIPILPLAAMKAGCAYQPLDPTNPRERLNFMVKDAETALLIVDPELTEMIDSYEGPRMLTTELGIENWELRMEKGETIKLTNPLTPKSLFVLLYTSGSTGVPKGVMLEHQNLVAFIQWYRRYYDLQPSSNVAAYASFGFDANMMDLYPALATGATTHIIPEEIRLDLVALNDYFNANHITHSFLTTQVGVQFLQNVDNHSLQHLSVGGEKLVSVEPSRQFTLHNGYGPTECTIFTTTMPVFHKEANIPIGKPVDALDCYVMDKHLHRLPVGAAGELVIVGNQVGRGYLNRPDKTAEAFFTYNGRRAYHSGDIVRYRPDGNIEFVGRKDGQVKIRGFRVELKEIESVIREFPGIKDATVQAFDDPNGGKFVAAYVVCDEEVDSTALNQFILDQKPPYMVPAVTMQIPEIPLNVNQKVDKKALPKPEKNQQTAGSGDHPAAPLNALEQELKSIVASVLNTEDFSITDVLGFVGLTSISSIKVAALIYKRFGVRLDSKTLSKTGTLQSMENEILAKWMAPPSDQTVQHPIPKPTQQPNDKTTEYQSPLTYAQQGVYMDCQMNPDTTMYNIPSMLEFPKETSTTALREAVKKVVEIHPALNCNFFQTEEGVVMRCVEGRTFEVGEKSLSAASLAAYRQQFVQPFDIENDWLVRAEVLTTDEESVFLLLDVHHLVMDGSSLDLFVRQILDVLESKAISPETCSYLGFAAKQQASEENLKNNKAFFDKMFENYESAANVPPDKSSSEAGLPRHIYTPIPRSLLALKLPLGVTQAHFWFAAFSYTLSRFANTKDVFTAFVSSGRSNVEIIDTVGMFVNTLPCAVHVKEQTVREFLEEVSEAFLESCDHEDYPFSRIAADYDFKGCASFAYQLGLKSGYCLNGQEVKDSHMALSKAKVPFSLFIQNNQGVPCVDAEYDDAQYSEDLALHFTESVVATAQHFALQMDDKVKHISIMSERQRREVEGMHSVREDMTFPVSTFHEGIERWADKSPDAMALMACDRNMTYREYNAEANRLARALKARGLQRGDRVVLLLPRRSYYLTAMFAVMKCGGAFIPMDPDYPADRIDYILDDSEGRFVLTTADRVDNYPGRAIDIMQLLDESATMPDSNVNVKVDPHDLAYLIYTSGSTGRPKGVMIEHLGAASFLHFYKSDTNFGTDSNANRIGLCQSTVSFDLSVGEIGVQVFNGDTVVFANEEEIMSPLEMVKLCRRTGAQTISGTPSRLAINLELDEYYDLVKNQIKCVVTGGEKLPATLLEQLEKMDVYIINTYGPTETTMGSSAGVLNGGREIHVGKPFTNYTYQVLDVDRNELPVGVMGELCIGGLGLARGYNNMPQRTAETFIEWQGKRIYRTGDYATWTKDGNIIILGRTDNQVKLNGLRIELGEIETVMSQQQGIRQSVAVIKKIGSVDKLVGYYTIDETVESIPVSDFEAQLRELMSQRLTPYMVPGVFVRLAEMPLTPVGKTDVKRLPMPELRSGAYSAPKNELEKVFCEIFAEALNCKQVGADDSFFELGGTSLLAMQLIAKSTKAGYPIIYKNVFDHPTPRLLAKMLKPELYGGEETHNRLPFAEEIEKYDYAQLDELLAANRIDTYLQGVRYDRIGSVLLTGSTGFLGIHVLQNLIMRSDVSNIYCLVRGNKLMSASSRLQMLLFYYFGNTYEELFGSRIFVVEGDVTDAHTFDAFEAPIDVVYNCAANVKHFSAGTDIEDINLKGCINCIDFCLRKGARFIQTSTGSVAGQTVSDSPVAPFILTERDLYNGQQLPSKYAASKFLAERAVLDAVKNRGLRGKVMRLGNLSARSTDGEFQINFRSNNAMSALKAYQVLGCIPYERDCGYSEYSPINEVAQAIVLLSLTPDGCTVFHPGNVHWPPYGDTIDCMNRIGIPIERVENDEFLRRLADAMQDTAKSELVQSLVAYKEAKDGRYRVVNGWDTKTYTAQVLLRLGFRWSFTSWDYIENYLRSIQGLGVFDSDFKRE